MSSLVIAPWFAARTLGALALCGGWLVTATISSYLLRSGSLRKSAIVYVAGTWLVSSFLIVPGGGIHSPFLVMYMALPISAAWLLGHRATLWTAALCIGSCLALALMETAGLGPYQYFPGLPIAAWALMVNAILIASVPVAQVMRTLRDSLAQSRLDQEALRKDRDLISRVMETSPAGIVTVNRDGRIEFANSRGARVLGMAPEELRQLRFDSAEWKITACDGRPLPAGQLPFDQVQSRREAIYDLQLAIQSADRRALLSVNAAPLLGATGEFDGMVATVEDVTERRRVEEELLRHQTQLEQLVGQRTLELAGALDQAQSANRAKTLFLANMSHELRTPLNSILGFSTLLQDQGLGAQQCQYIEMIKRSGEHLLNQIDDVLDMAKIEAGKQELQLDPCDLISLVYDVTEMMRVRAQDRKLALVCIQPPGLPRYLRADAPKLRQVLINLLGNAIKFTQEGTVTLRIAALATDDPGRVHLRFEVEDTGAGIAPQDQARIFEPFVQAGKPAAQKGTGLGLAITRRFVETMGGTIAVESAPGHGSRFTVEVPLELAGSAEVPGPSRGERQFVLEPGQPECRILIVEDTPENAMLLEQMLTHAGFQVRAADNGALGVEAFEQWRPHFIWMDIAMPELSGTDATRRIRALEGGREVKIAALTAPASGSAREEVLAAGLDDFVRKPFRREDVFDCLARHLGVRYRGPEPATGGQGDVLGRLRPEALTALPSELRRKLEDAVLSLHPERIMFAIEEVSVADETLAAVLRRLANQFAYTEILDAIQHGALEAASGPAN